MSNRHTIEGVIQRVQVTPAACRVQIDSLVGLPDWNYRACIPNQDIPVYIPDVIHFATLFLPYDTHSIKKEVCPKFG